MVFALWVVAKFAGKGNRSTLTLDEFKKGYLALQTHVKNKNMQEGVNKIKAIDDSWKMALRTTTAPPEDIHAYYAHIREGAADFICQNIKAIASMALDKNKISQSDMETMWERGLLGEERPLR